MLLPARKEFGRFWPAWLELTVLGFSVVVTALKVILKKEAGRVEILFRLDGPAL